jgi:hypothetical protein
MSGSGLYLTDSQRAFGETPKPLYAIVTNPIYKGVSERDVEVPAQDFLPDGVFVPPLPAIEDRALRAGMSPR